MLDENEYRKKVYDETALLISDLLLRSKINAEEMSFLLQLLENIFRGERNATMLALLEEWQKKNANTEIDEIIKATWLSTDLQDKESVSKNLSIITELMNAEE